MSKVDNSYLKKNLSEEENYLINNGISGKSNGFQNEDIKSSNSLQNQDIIESSNDLQNEDIIKSSNSLQNEDTIKLSNDGTKQPFSFSSCPNLEDIRQIHAKFTSDRNWDQFHTPRNILLALVGEVGELSELFQWKNECEVGLKDWSQNERKALEEELSDVLIYLVRLADRCRVDLPSVVIEKFKKNEKKYPIDKAYGSSKKYTEYQ